MVSEAVSSDAAFEAAPQRSPAVRMTSFRPESAAGTAASKGSYGRTSGAGRRTAVALIACMAAHLAAAPLTTAAPLLLASEAAAGPHVTVLAGINTAVLEGIQRQKVRNYTTFSVQPLKLSVYGYRCPVHCIDQTILTVPEWRQPVVMLIKQHG